MPPVRSQNLVANVGRNSLVTISEKKKKKIKKKKKVDIYLNKHGSQLRDETHIMKAIGASDQGDERRFLEAQEPSGASSESEKSSSLGAGTRSFSSSLVSLIAILLTCCSERCSKWLPLHWDQPRIQP
ncbi:hypothetical protein ISCGN_007171 [Ixodes scapularis]